MQNSFAQVVSIQDSSIVLRDTSQFVDSRLYDVVDLFQDLNPFRKADTTSTQKTRSGISYLPNINYNPSIGFQIGLKAVGGVYLGDKKTTSMSIFATSANYTTRGIFYAYLAHDTYTKDNRWNLKGNLVGAKLVGLDYGLGMGVPLENPEVDEAIMNNPERDRYVNHYNVYGFSERLYKQLLPGMFVGGGVFFELKRQVRTSSEFNTSPNVIYSGWNNFNATQNNNNGLMFNLQYLTRDNPNSAYTGIYTDVVLRMNQIWMGSQKNAYQLQTDVRKYWQLSERRPNHVLAFWNYGSYNIGGSLFYLDLPGTGKDPYARSGRGYTNGYFKGISFFYSEIEYRFPILKNQFLSGVFFANVQTANDQMGTKLFQQWQPAGGGGLRVLFNKMTRTNLCIDYAFGKFGQRGLFLGLNEAF
ncbi:hypothetical protein GCM10011418_24420 [Sphingobacterium alkalisoli]|nr:hypothetical protein GCM10011418_24420 [Sphingobacterium alkalisoli]